MDRDITKLRQEFKQVPRLQDLKDLLKNIAAADLSTVELGIRWALFRGLQDHVLQRAEADDAYLIMPGGLLCIDEDRYPEEVDALIKLVQSTEFEDDFYMFMFGTFGNKNIFVDRRADIIERALKWEEMDLSSRQELIRDLIAVQVKNFSDAVGEDIPAPEVHFSSDTETDAAFRYFVNNPSHCSVEVPYRTLIRDNCAEVLSLIAHESFHFFVHCLGLVEPENHHRLKAELRDAAMIRHTRLDTGIPSSSRIYSVYLADPEEYAAYSYDEIFLVWIQEALENRQALADAEQEMRGLMKLTDRLGQALEQIRQAKDAYETMLANSKILPGRNDDGPSALDSGPAS